MHQVKKRHFMPTMNTVYPKFNLLNLSKNDNYVADKFKTQLLQLQATMKPHL